VSNLLAVNRAIPLRAKIPTAVPAARRGRAAAPWEELKEKIILLGRQDGLRWRG
jgi:hypothetical protein